MCLQGSYCTSCILCLCGEGGAEWGGSFGTSFYIYGGNICTWTHTEYLFEILPHNIINAPIVSTSCNEDNDDSASGADSIKVISTNGPTLCQLSGNP